MFTKRNRIPRKEIISLYHKIFSQFLFGGEINKGVEVEESFELLYNVDIMKVIGNFTDIGIKVIDNSIAMVLS